MALPAVRADLVGAVQVPFLDPAQALADRTAYGLYAFLLKELHVRAGAAERERSQFMH